MAPACCELPVFTVEGHPMSQHPDTSLTPRGRETLVYRMESGGRRRGRPPDGRGRQTVSKRLSRARADEPMPDRSCRPRRPTRLTPSGTEARVREARSGLPGLVDVAHVTGGHQRDPVTGVRCERERPGEFVHVDVKRAVRIPDGRSGACAGFMSPSPVFSAGLGAAVERVMTVNGPGYRSREFNCPLEAEEGPAQTHVPLQPLAEREGRADEPDARAGVVVRKGVGRRGGQGRGPGRLHRALQFDPPPARRVQGVYRPCRVSSA